MTGQEEWTRQTLAAAVARLRGEDGRPRPVVLVYTRQSKTDFDKDGKPKGPSLEQQLDSVLRLPDLQGLEFEHYQDADLSGKSTAKRKDYLRLVERIQNAEPGEIGAIAFYMLDRSHRNELEMFQFMADMTERGILVYEATSGLVSSVDNLSWKIKAVVAQEERERIARRVRDNLQYLKRQGALLGILPQGLMRVDGEVVVDPEAAPIVQQIFALYKTGQHSYGTLAEHLNREGIRPCRGPQKDNHNRKRAVIFTADVLKDILSNRSYMGKLVVDGELTDGSFPALVDEDTWNACQDARHRNRRRTTQTWTRHSYPFTVLLRCAKCGTTMRGKSSGTATKPRLYYACGRRHRQWSTDPTPVCEAPYIPVGLLDQAIRDELRRFVPSPGMERAFRRQLTDAQTRNRPAKRVTETAIKRLEDQLARVARLYEFGEYEWEAYVVKRAEIRGEIDRLRATIEQQPEPDLTWCEVQMIDLLAAWDAGDEGQRSRLLSGIFEGIEAEMQPGGELVIIATPRAAWTPFFEEGPLERETGIEPATSTLAR
jgi:site-specific DNA recombinase